MKNNIILDTDSYKMEHYKQYPRNVTHVYSYLESRGGAFPKTVFFGLQYYLQEYLEGNVVTSGDVTQAMEFTEKHFGRESLNVEGWDRIVDEHCGRLPVVIKALPEGTICDVSTPLMTIENTDPELPWITNFIETKISRLWYSTTVATQSYYMKQILLDGLEKTGTPEDIDFKLHDFGCRGVSSLETAAIGGAAHLTSFMGSDNIPGIIMLKDHYGSDCAGFSIPATEHSTITSWGRENELDACRNVLKQYPTGPVACVSDSYDIFNACANIWGRELREEIMSRDGTLIVRPDSQDMRVVVLKCLNILGDKFGYTVNQKGFKVLPSCIRLIQGDGVDICSEEELIGILMDAKWSIDNIALGSGGALLQKLDRDTNKFAFKCSNVTRNGVDCGVYKDPVGAGFKKSKQGRFEGLPEVFRDGEILKTYTLDEIRARINTY